MEKVKAYFFKSICSNDIIEKNGHVDGTFIFNMVLFFKQNWSGQQIIDGWDFSFFVF